ncbi:MAG: hypothetical protein AAB038_03310, partial [Planctomycetota bacterium]
LAELSNDVYTIDRLPELAQTAQKRLEGLGYRSVHYTGLLESQRDELQPSIVSSNSLPLKLLHYKTGDGTLGWEEFAPYDRIIVSAGSPSVPNKLVEQLNVNNGILLCPVGNEFSQDLIRIIKRFDHIEQDNLGSCVFVKLIGADGWKE